MRKIIGALVLAAYIVVYIALVAGLSGRVAVWSSVVQIVFFAVAGCVWVVPLRFLIVWMHKHDGIRR